MERRNAEAEAREANLAYLAAAAAAAAKDKDEEWPSESRFVGTNRPAMPQAAPVVDDREVRSSSTSRNDTMRRKAERRDEVPPPTSDEPSRADGPGSGRYLPPMPYRTPSHPENERLFLRFPYFNPEAELFRNPLARLAAGRRLEVPTGGLLGLYQWGVAVEQQVSLPPSAPVTVQDDGLSSRIGPLEVRASRSTWLIQLHLPETMVAGGDGASTTLGGRLYWRTDWNGLNTLTTMGHDTSWRATLPTPGDVLPDQALPGSEGSVGVYVKSASVRVLLTLAAIVAIAAAGYGIYYLMSTSPLLLQPGLLRP